jgi:quercetin 2,3-dioxygenase
MRSSGFPLERAVRSASGTRSAEPLLRPAGERFHSRLDWLDSWHSFSFGEHHDPAWMGFGPLRVINDDTIAGGCGFGLHPHRDMEIITVMVEGELEHRDSLGHSERLRAGEVQRMSAGTGVLHSERNPTDQSCRLLQIWIEPTRRGLAPSYEQRPFAVGHDWTLLLDPERRDGAMAIHRPVRLFRACPGPGHVLTLPCGPGRLVWLQLVSGTLVVPLHLKAGDGLGWSTVVQSAPLVAGENGADLLLFDLA